MKKNLESDYPDVDRLMVAYLVLDAFADCCYLLLLLLLLYCNLSDYDAYLRRI